VERPERALRRMIARMPALAPDDCDMILDSLGDRQRARVLALLAQIDGPPVAAETVRHASIEPGPLQAGLSPWLLDRAGLRQPEAGGLPRAGEMTQHARLALRRCAAGIGQSDAKLGAEGGLSLFGVLRRRVVQSLGGKARST